VADVVALVDDIFFQSKIQETARHVGVNVRFYAQAAALLQEIAAQSPKLVIIDLNARTGALEAIEQMAAQQITAPVIAFLSHVQVDLAERARAAGCREVMPRSKFTQDLATILAQAKS
jgi:FixJ family two-component response regulator